MRGSKYGRPFVSRAERSLKLLRSINGLRLYRERNGTREPTITVLENKLRELDEIHGYTRSSRGVRATRPLANGERARSVSQASWRRA